MKIKIRDLELVLSHIKTEGVEIVEVKLDTSDHPRDGYSFVYQDKNRRLAKLMVFDSDLSITPEVVSTQKLYKKD